MHYVIYLIPCWSQKLLGKKHNWYKIQYVFKHLGWWKSEDGLDLWLTFPFRQEGCCCFCWKLVMWVDNWKKGILYLLIAFPVFLEGMRTVLGIVSGELTRSKTSVLTLVIRENNSRDCTCSLKITCDRNCDVLSLIIFLSNFCKKNICVNGSAGKMNSGKQDF